ncbi:MAG: GNAT family N-acetyltransferase [Acidimicrobiia bacterium]|nr:GNAT family N-acetyltransferase [Acidimicrobiia bacterium]
MTVTFVVRPALTADLDHLVQLQDRLFAEDAGAHGAFVDLGWPLREGEADLSGLIESPDALVLIATAGREQPTDPAGILVGYVSKPTPTRLPVDFAVLRGLYVISPLRSAGIGGAMIEAFFDWATDRGCVEAHVEAYAANEGAQRFYQRHGFEVRSLSRARPLGSAGGNDRTGRS